MRAISLALFFIPFILTGLDEVCALLARHLRHKQHALYERNEGGNQQEMFERAIEDYCF
jgi:hypothetical protein